MRSPLSIFLLSASSNGEGDEIRNTRGQQASLGLARGVVEAKDRAVSGAHPGQQRGRGEEPSPPWHPKVLRQTNDPSSGQRHLRVCAERLKNLLRPRPGDTSHRAFPIIYVEPLPHLGAMLAYIRSLLRRIE